MHRFEGVLKFLIILSNISFYIKWSGHLAASAHTVLMPLACKDSHELGTVSYSYAHYTSSVWKFIFRLGSKRVGRQSDSSECHLSGRNRVLPITGLN